MRAFGLWSSNFFTAQISGRSFFPPRPLATFRSALLEVDPNLEINYKSAAWDVMKYLAFSNQKKYLNPDELSNRQANSHAASGTLLSRLRKRTAA
jgi:hypothetical protein